ncbi:hypothetical protein VIBNISOn1_190049 [Vibrio nigripulchritudo SOn1]|uniref:Toprim domain-containing protein n=1 Tax=Vibrio nigripulchritudo SOn1 TaxID=1238450 RepID=A0AAV2VQ22_9VIBR|nr:toprim domain-containing protein [Vibrio nigripulchritudo]CCO46830.1 hypothetical protein VIBNISOn1_190049 [Vibrio nigripulchritudo SOn1]
MSGKKVVFAESPITASNIHRASGMDAMATYGHLFDYEYINNKIGLVAKNPVLVERIALQNTPSQTLILATDNDAQGELIAQHIQALTPRAIHHRVHIKELTKDGIESAISRPTKVNHQLANEGAYVRLLNLKLRKLEPRGILTTTSVTIAKSIETRGRLNQLNNFTISHNGQEYFTRFPSELEKHVKGVTPPLPAITRNITMLAAFQDITNVHAALQELYQTRRLSYIRTDSAVLPSSNLLYDEHISEEGLKSAHYAIYNLTPYSSDLERYVYKINESAVSSNYHALTVKTSLGNVIALDEPMPNCILRPSSELMLHLSLDDDSFASTISSAAQRYERLFYKGRGLDESLVAGVRAKARKLVPEVYEKGIKHVLKTDNPITTEHVREQRQALEKVAKNKEVETCFSKDSDINHFMGY